MPYPYVFPRSPEPDIYALSLQLQPVIGDHLLYYESEYVYIDIVAGVLPEGVELVDIDTIVQAATNAGSTTPLKMQLRSLGKAERAIILTLLDYLNTERTEHARGAVNEATFMAAAETKVDTL